MPAHMDPGTEKPGVVIGQGILYSKEKEQAVEMGMRPDTETYSTAGSVGLKDQFGYSHPQWEVSII